MRLLTLSLYVLLGTLVVSTGIALPAAALSASDWRASNIIDDAVFTDKNEMSVAQIQQFLNNKVPVCDTWGTQQSEFGGGTRAQYGAANGNPAPFTCLKDYYEVPKTSPGPGTPASNYGGAPVPSGAISAAQIIWNAAQKHNISPAVLLVKLGTESAGPLTSDDWPFHKQYLYAMGAHCPDSGPGGSANCDPNYAGFSLQMDEGASLMRWYLDSMTQSWWSYKKPYQNNHILWNVSESGCGGADVYIENKATAALYTYTPYQPNQAALNNLYGTGDGCSAYGNRNFWRVYNDWFGPSRDRNPIVRSWESGRMFVRSGNGNLYYIADAGRLNDLGYGSGRLTGFSSVDDTYVWYHNAGDLPSVLTFGSAPEVYFYERGVLHYIDYATYQAYGSPAVGNLPSYTKGYFTEGAKATTVLRNYVNGDVYRIANGAKRYVVGPEAYSHYSIGSISMVEAGVSILGNIPEDAPLAKPGTLIHNGTSSAGIVDSTGNSLYPASTKLLNATSATRFSVPPGLFAKYSMLSTATIGLLAKDANNNLYILNRANRINLTSSQLALVNYSANDFVLAPDSFLNRLTPVSTTSNDLIVRINSDQHVYVIRNKELLRFENSGDFHSFGYDFPQVYDLSSTTADTLFTNRNITILPAGLLIRASDNPRVYLVTKDGVKAPIPTAYLFNNIGYKFEWVRVTTPQAVDYLTTEPSLSPYAQTSSGETWLLRNGVKRLLPSSVSAQYNLSPPASPSTPWHQSC